MQPSSQTDVAPHVHGEILDGRDSLRLVKIRLALTLIAVAIIPIAAVAPVARALLDDSRMGLEGRLSAEAEQSAGAIRGELNGIVDALDGLAASDAIADSLAAAAGEKAFAAAAVQLAKVLERPSGVVSAVAIVDSEGAVPVRVGSEQRAPGSLAPPTIGQPVFNLVPNTREVPMTLEIAVEVPAAANDRSVGSVVASVPVSALLLWASPDAPASSGRSVSLVDARGQSLASIGPVAGIDLPGTVIELAANGPRASEGRAPVALPSLGDWRVVVRAPLPVTSIPIPAVVALMGLLGLLVGITWWMGRQIVRPAALLEAQRARLQELYQSAREAALRDGLTGLGNHRAFQEAVTRMVDQSRRYGTPFSLILLDIDEFKRINDTQGHATGDELLAEVGQLIRATVRQADAGYRIGGDEFAVLLPSTDAAGAEATARRLLSRGLEDRPGGRYRGAISFSAGVTACPAFGATRIELTTQADAALYRGKRAGRTVVSVFDPDLDRGHIDDGMRAELSAAVSVIVETGALTPVFQPIVHLPTGRILGYEGLVRVAPERGFPDTGALFDAAELGGRVLALDRAALDVVLRGAHRIPPPTLVSLNVSPRSFEAPEFSAASFLSILRRHDLAPDRVLLELTERGTIRDPERLRTAMVQLREVGVRIAADDVGAGNAGLRLLSQFRFDVVKIDLSLVQGGAGGDQALSVLTSLVQLARRWGALTIAEGVETTAQLHLIRRQGIDAAQGYLLGRPGAVLDADRIDLDALAGGTPAQATSSGATALASSSGAVPGPSATADGAGVPTGAGDAFGAAGVLARQPPSRPLPRPAFAGRDAPEPVPTAASIIAGGAPNPFARP